MNVPVGESGMQKLEPDLLRLGSIHVFIHILATLLSFLTTTDQRLHVPVV